MTEVTVHQAKTHLSRLLRRVATGEEVVISRSGTPVARIVPIEAPVERRLGRDRGRLEIAPDFDGPLPPEVLGDFEA